MTVETLAVAAAVAAMPAAGVGVMAALGGAGAAHPLRGPVAIGVAVWAVLTPYVAAVVLG